jgi:hypothetical protein
MKTLAKFINSNQSKDVDKLSTDAQVLFGFLSLIIDIKYRNRYGITFTEQNSKGYSNNMNVLADQVSPVDDGLLGH